ncbi:hypothetical protein ACP70R_046569 [Stipagrostis hirtigluma subsp. patula]
MAHSRGSSVQQKQQDLQWLGTFGLSEVPQSCEVCEM